MKVSPEVSRRSFLGGCVKAGSVAVAAPLITACSNDAEDNYIPVLSDHKVALLADVHFHDVYGDYEFAGYNSEVTMRSMQDSVGSTRMFNENYFAFITALEELGEQGIKYICLLGDFTDDGQVDTLKGFNRVVKSFVEKYGFEFFIANGNHDPVRPYGAHQTKNFLNNYGASIAVTSDANRGFTPNEIVVEQHVTNRMFGTGYQYMFDVLGEYGFHSKPNYLHYETPWGSENFEDRGLFLKSANGHSLWCPDATYLAEPVQDLWICSVDMNIYLPNDDGSFSHASIGWEEGKIYKPQVFTWLKEVSQRAKEQGKALVVFSHYPVTEYLNNSSNDFFYLFGDESYNNRRVPTPDTGDKVIEAGIRVQFGGHIHVNDTAVHRNEQGAIVNVQAPSLAAYTPSYKILTPRSPNLFEIETRTLKNVNNFDALFPHYMKEKEYRESVNQNVHWGIMLKAKDYREFMAAHLEVRFQNNMGWGEDMGLISNIKTPLFWAMALSDLARQEVSMNSLSIQDLLETMVEEGATDSDVISKYEELTGSTKAMEAAILAVEEHISESGISREIMIEYTFDLMCKAAIYQRNGDELAIKDLTYDLLVPMNIAASLFAACDANGNLDDIDWETDYVGQDPNNGRSVKLDDMNIELLKTRFAALARVYHQFSQAQPADHFTIDLENGVVTDLAGNKLLG